MKRIPIRPFSVNVLGTSGFEILYLGLPHRKFGGQFRLHTIEKIVDTLNETYETGYNTGYKDGFNTGIKEGD